MRCHRTAVPGALICCTLPAPDSVLPESEEIDTRRVADASIVEFDIETTFVSVYGKAPGAWIVKGYVVDRDPSLFSATAIACRVRRSEMVDISYADPAVVVANGDAKKVSEIRTLSIITLCASSLMVMPLAAVVMVRLSMATSCVEFGTSMSMPVEAQAAQPRRVVHVDDVASAADDVGPRSGRAERYDETGLKAFDEYRRRRRPAAFADRAASTRSDRL